MRILFLLAMFPLFLFGQDLRERADPPLGFYKEPIMKVDREVQNQWMDGKAALENEMKRNERLFYEHQFPLVKTALFILLGICVILVILFDEKVMKRIKRLFVKPLESKESAKSKLQQLNQVKDWREGYSHLSQTLREYIQRQYHIPALVQTKEEWIKKLAKETIYSSEEQKELSQLFTRIEQVEFAGVHPTKDSYQQAKKIVEKMIK